jgi:cell division protein FtsZ
MSLAEISDAVSIIQNEAHEDANIIFGAVIDEEMGDAVNVTVIATGFGRVDSVRKPETTLNAKALVEEAKADKVAARTVVPGARQDPHVPAFIRRSLRETQGRRIGLDDYVEADDDNLDIPTFLRKQAE